MMMIPIVVFFYEQNDKRTWVWLCKHVPDRAQKAWPAKFQCNAPHYTVKCGQSELCTETLLFRAHESASIATQDGIVGTNHCRNSCS